MVGPDGGSPGINFRMVGGQPKISRWTWLHLQNELDRVTSSLGAEVGDSPGSDEGRAFLLPQVGLWHSAAKGVGRPTADAHGRARFWTDGDEYSGQHAANIQTTNRRHTKHPDVQ